MYIYIAAIDELSVSIMKCIEYDLQFVYKINKVSSGVTEYNNCKENMII